MHDIHLTPELLNRIRARRDRVHPFERLNGGHTAHLVIDLQNGFLEPGAPLEVPNAREIVPNVNAIASALRRHGGRNVFIRMTIDPETSSSWSNWFEHMHSASSGAVIAQAFAREAHYWQLWPQLEIAHADERLEKTRFGAFVAGSSRLDELLRAAGIDTVIISGTLTNVCCESTARDAMQMNYKVVFVADATATISDAAHNATLENMAVWFADVMTTAEILRALGEPNARMGELGSSTER